jgi:hypothetical protein
MTQIWLEEKKKISRNPILQTIQQLVQTNMKLYQPTTEPGNKHSLSMNIFGNVIVNL